MGMNSAPNPSPTIATRTLRSVAMGAAPRRCVGDQNCSQDTAAPGPGQRGANEESPPRVGGLSCPHLLVPTLCVGTSAGDALRPLSRSTAERCPRRSHAERGNEELDRSPPPAGLLPLAAL